MLMSKFWLGHVLGNALAAFFSTGLLSIVNRPRMEYMLGRKPTNFSIGTLWVASFIFHSTFLFHALYRKWSLEYSEVSK